MQQQTNSPDGLLGFLSDAYKTVTAFPGKVITWGEALNQDIINISRDVQNKFEQGGQEAKENLKRTEVRRAGGDFMEWITVPQNAIISTLILVSAIWILRGK